MLPIPYKNEDQSCAAFWICTNEKGFYSELSTYQLLRTLKYEFVYLNQNLIFFNSTDEATSYTAVFNGFCLVWTDWTLLYKSSEVQVKAESSFLCLAVLHLGWKKKSEMMVPNKNIASWINMIKIFKMGF